MSPLVCVRPKAFGSPNGLGGCTRTAALDSANMDTDRSARIDIRWGSMKLIAQIAAGIFLAGAISWVFWLSIFAAAAPEIAKSLPHFVPATPTIIPSAPLERTPKKAVCVNFVQMANGDRRCLENQHAEWRIESAALPQPQPRPTEH